MTPTSEPLDHGELNIPLAKRYGRGGIDAAIDRYKRDEAKKAAAQHREDVVRRKAEREVEKARPKMTAEDVRGARFVRDQFGWHHVARVSAKSVSVKTPYSWTDRIPLTKILEVR